MEPSKLGLYRLSTPPMIPINWLFLPKMGAAITTMGCLVALPKNGLEMTGSLLAMTSWM